MSIKFSLSFNKVLLYVLLGLLSGSSTGCLAKVNIEQIFSGTESQASSLMKTSAREKVSSQEKVFPDDIGWINVKKDFGARGDGITDDTVAIKKAIEAPYGDYTRPKILYFPAGTYLVSDTLQLKSGQYACCVTFQGQGREHTVIKLRDNADGFNNKIQSKAVIKTNRGNAAFRNFFRDLTINTGSNNPGAVGIDYISNNRGSIINVAIKSEDGLGKAGLSMIRQWPGPSLIKYLSVDGFDYGIHTRHPEYGLTLEHIELKNQNVVGILNESNTLAIRKIKSNNSVPVINNKNGLVIAIEGEFKGGSKEGAAIENKGYLYARDIKAENYRFAIKDRQKTLAKFSLDEYVSHPIYSLFNNQSSSLNLPIEETPYYHDNNLNNWANVKNYPTIQAAMNSGKSTIYFPMGQYTVNEAVTVPKTVKKIIGFESFINLNQSDSKAIFSIEEDSKDPLIVEGLLFNNTTISRVSPRTLVMKHVKFNKQNNLNDDRKSGKLFLEDVQMNLQVHKNQQVWARQLNSETLFEGETKIINSGGKLWILGLKTEGKGTVIETKEQGETELLGTLIYPVEKFTQAEKLQAAFINNESDQSLIYSVSVHGINRNYDIQVKEIKEGETRKLLSQDVKDLKIPLFVGY